MKPKLLDLFCGAGGAAMGYHRAGFDVVGVDIKPQPHYPFHFHQADALEFCREFGREFDAIHASPPCQAYAGLASKDGRHPALIEPTRTALRHAGKAWCIENIEGAPLLEPTRLCGSMFNLNVRRHRLFELSIGPLLIWPCSHSAQKEIRGYYGRNYGPALVSRDAIQRKGRKPLFRGTQKQAVLDMGIDWMEWDELRNAIPPAYTEWIGRQLLRVVQ